MTRLAGEYPVRWLCRLFDCPRAGLYRAPRVADDFSFNLAGGYMSTWYAMVITRCWMPCFAAACPGYNSMNRAAGKWLLLRT